MKISGAFRKRVLSHDWVTGTFLTLGSSVTTEIAGSAGFDWILIDHEHGPGGEETLLHQLQAAAATPAVPIVRIAANEAPRFKRVLDAGAQGVMVPYVNTEAEGRAAVAAMRYPPRGTRGVAKVLRASGYGQDFEDYYLHAHDWIVLVAQIETPEAVDHARAIAAVDGVDVLFVGPTDLTYNLGIRDQFDNPAYIDAQKRVVAAAKGAGKAAGILINNPALVERSRDLGFTFVALGSDGGTVASGIRQIASTLRAAGIPPKT
jgi:4-hydroxy-2-oxoheptanedioate aldolase